MFCFPNRGLRELNPLSSHNLCVDIRGVARIFQRGDHSRDTIRGSPTIYGLYRCSPSCISGLSRIIAAWRPILTKDKSRWRKYFTKKQILKKWTFQQWLLRPRCHGVFATWILKVVCSKKGSSGSSPLVSYSGAPRALRARVGGAPYFSKSTHPRKFGNHVTVHQPPTADRPSAPQENQCLLSHF